MVERLANGLVVIPTSSALVVPLMRAAQEIIPALQVFTGQVRIGGGFEQVESAWRYWHRMCLSLA
jgi:hypothetical protein